MTFEEARAQFPVLERYAYLNAGSNGPLAPESGPEWPGPAGNSPLRMERVQSAAGEAAGRSAAAQPYGFGP